MTTAFKKLDASFFLRHDVVAVARDLLGKLLVTNLAAGQTIGRIVETEAYEGEIDRASHAFRGKTGRTKVMYEEGGRAYIYLCYGIHHMFNVVSGPAGTPHAVLIRAVEPVKGIELMLQRTGKAVADASLTRGPGNVGKAFGFHTAQTGSLLTKNKMFIADDDFCFPDALIGSSPRIGVAYADDHALWPYRFFIRGNPYVSGKTKQ